MTFPLEPVLPRMTVTLASENPLSMVGTAEVVLFGSAMVAVATLDIISVRKIPTKGFFVRRRRRRKNEYRQQSQLDGELYEWTANCKQSNIGRLVSLLDGRSLLISS